MHQNSGHPCATTFIECNAVEANWINTCLQLELTSITLERRLNVEYIWTGIVTDQCIHRHHKTRSTESTLWTMWLRQAVLSNINCNSDSDEINLNCTVSIRASVYSLSPFHHVIHPPALHVLDNTPLSPTLNVLWYDMKMFLYFSFLYVYLSYTRNISFRLSDTHSHHLVIFLPPSYLHFISPGTDMATVIKHNRVSFHPCMCHIIYLFKITVSIPL